MPSIHPAALERGAQTAGAGSGSAPGPAGRRHLGRAQPGVGVCREGGSLRRRGGGGEGVGQAPLLRQGCAQDLAGGKLFSREDDSNLG